ncbi:MAG: hypothetical protein ABIP48_08430 [Planctomycetota bacterium]
MAPHASWQDALLAMRPDFEVGALRFPDLRMYLFRGNARHESEVGLDLLNLAREVEFPGIDFSRPIMKGCNIGPDELGETIELNGQTARCQTCNYVTLCGNSAGARRFLEIAHGAGRCVAGHVPWASDYDDALIHGAPDMVWIDTIFRVAWEHRNDSPLCASKRVGGKLPEGCFCSFLRMNPFRASVLLVDMLVNEPPATVEKGLAEAGGGKGRKAVSRVGAAIEKRRLTSAELNVLARDYLKEHATDQHQVRSRELAGFLKGKNPAGTCSTSTVGKLPAWRAYQDELGLQGRKGKKTKLKAITLTKAIEATTGDHDPKLRRLIQEQHDNMEPSPLEDDPPDAPPRKVKERKRV